MAQVLERKSEPVTLDRVLTMKPTPRVEKLRETLLGLTLTASIERARIETRAMKATEGEPTVTSRAKVFAAVLRELPVDIYPDELLVGCTSVAPRCTSISPMNAAFLTDETQARIYGYNRKGTAANLSDAEKKELEEELTPYWRQQGRVGKGSHYGHNIHAFEKVLRKGFLGIKKDAEERLARLDLTEPEELKKVPFLEGVVIAMEAAAEVGERYAARARELAEKEEDAGRKADLLKIAEVCDWVPANPARTFHEAVQSYYFAWALLFLEVPYDLGFSQGRVDQYLYPYYERDVREGRITNEEVQELIDCYILKVNFEGHAGSIGVGGVKPDGNDATNELSYMLIEGMMHTRLVSPYFALLVHSKTPDDLLIRACQLCALGSGHPQFLNSDVMVAQALARGDMGGPMVTLADARSAANVGCLELVIPGKDSGYIYYDGSNLASLMELVLTNGARRSDGKKLGAETGDPRQFTSFEQVREAYHQQVAWMMRNIQIAGNLRERTIAELSPTVYESALIDDCIENGTCREEGGAHYNFNIGGVELGSSDAGDSLAALKGLVFDEKQLTMAELCDALDASFEGHEEVRRMCLEAPKFGNDNDYVDDEVAWVLHQWATEFQKMKNTRGGYGCPGGSPMASYVPAGKVVGALPSGRLAWEPLADAASPSAGKDLNGPTGVLKSMGKIDNVEILGGIVLNMRIDPTVVQDADGIKRFADMIRAFVDQKIYHVQINVVSSDTLRAAQKEPEKYRDLMVKVAGYNAYFTHLSKTLQDSIIARTAHAL